MEPLVFLSAVLPSVGKLCVAVIDDTAKVQFFVDSHEELQRTTELQDMVGRTTYMALASFDDAKSRKAEHALYMRSLFLDLDCGPKKMYASKREAVEALIRFMTDTRLGALGTPWLVDSGGGIHVYWPLDRDVPIAGWRHAADALKRAAHASHFKIDNTVTADAARVLRMPGTHNRKYGPDCLVTLRQVGDVFSLSQIMDCIADVRTESTVTLPPSRSTALALPGKPLARAPSATAVALAANRVTYFKNILTRTAAGDGCAQLDYYIKHAQEDGMEPLWRGLLSIAKPCVDGLKAATVLSRMHPYDVDRMHTKLAEIRGPYPCVKLDSENPGVCGGCKHWGQITNPLALGRETQLVDEAQDVEYADAGGGAQTVHRPKPPIGFSYGGNGGVYYTKTDVDKTGETSTREIMLLPFDFFMLDMLVEDGVFVTRFMSIKQGTKQIVVIPNKVVTSVDATMAALASQNIVAAFGAGNDKNLYTYVRACIGDASVTDCALLVPPNYGWQEDGTFAIGDQILRPDGTGYTFVSERLSNLISVTRPHGTLEDWVAIVNMLMRKKLWGQVANLLLSFGSPLKRFTPAGARAFTFHIASSASGVGKTLALSLGNSVWGHPVNFSVKPATSERTMLQRAGMLGSLPLNIDEITNKVRAGDKEWLPNHIFDFSQGGHKLKGQGASNAEMRDDLHWESNSTLTSNAPMMEAMMGARETTSNGEMYRLLEWRARERLTWEPHERELLKQLDKNYGVAGLTWARWLVQNQDKAQQAVVEALDGWRERLHAPDEERFWTAGAASAIAALTLLGPRHANIIAIPMQPIFEFFKLRVQEARRIINTNQTYANDLLNVYIRENHGGFIKVTSPDQKFAVFADGREVSKDSTKGAVRGRVEYNMVPGWTDFYIDIRMLKEFCARRNRSYIEFVQELQTRVSVAEVRKDLLAKTKGPAYRVLCLKISQRNEDVEQ